MVLTMVKGIRGQQRAHRDRGVSSSNRGVSCSMRGAVGVSSGLSGCTRGACVSGLL